MNPFNGSPHSPIINLAGAQAAFEEPTFPNPTPKLLAYQRAVRRRLTLAARQIDDARREAEEARRLAEYARDRARQAQAELAQQAEEDLLEAERALGLAPPAPAAPRPVPDMSGLVDLLGGPLPAPTRVYPVTSPTATGAITTASVEAMPEEGPDDDGSGI
jgi:hypothetical protein